MSQRWVFVTIILVHVSACQPDWQVFVSKEGRFRVLMPGQPKTQTLPANEVLGVGEGPYFYATLMGELSSNMVKALFQDSMYAGKGMYSVLYADLEGELAEDVDQELFFKRLRDQQVGVVDSRKTDETAEGSHTTKCEVGLLEERSISLGDYSG